MILGYLLAVLGALGSGIGSVLESIGVRRAGAYGGDAEDLGLIARQPTYWSGVALDVAGFVCAAGALHRLPLFLVQSVMAFSVGITAAISVLLGTRLHRRGWISLAVAAAGLVLLGLSAQPGPSRTLPHVWHWLMLAVVGPQLAIAVVGSRTHRRWTAPLLAFGAGLGFTVVALAARTLHFNGGLGSLLAEPAAWAIAVNGVTATAIFALALQKGGATTVSAVMFTTDTVLPAAIGLVFLGDVIRDRAEWAGGLGFVMAVAGAVALAHYSALAGPPVGTPAGSRGGTLYARP